MTRKNKFRDNYLKKKNFWWSTRKREILWKDEKDFSLFNDGGTFVSQGERVKEVYGFLTILAKQKLLS